mmetsp:Transcript_23060/g.91449  ORF Transcript_23060/g.91449 Transcript_23060/m.91449 type:complete len:245 (+) Transcript_23060:604-1338(+)
MSQGRRGIDRRLARGRRGRWVRHVPPAALETEPRYRRRRRMRDEDVIESRRQARLGERRAHGDGHSVSQLHVVVEVPAQDQRQHGGHVVRRAITQSPEGASLIGFRRRRPHLGLVRLGGVRVDAEDHRSRRRGDSAAQPRIHVVRRRQHRAVAADGDQQIDALDVLRAEVLARHDAHVLLARGVASHDVGELVDAPVMRLVAVAEPLPPQSLGRLALHLELAVRLEGRVLHHDQDALVPPGPPS